MGSSFFPVFSPFGSDSFPVICVLPLGRSPPRGGTQWGCDFFYLHGPLRRALIVQGGAFQKFKKGLVLLLKHTVRQARGMGGPGGTRMGKNYRKQEKKNKGPIGGGDFCRYGMFVRKPIFSHKGNLAGEPRSEGDELKGQRSVKKRKELFRTRNFICFSRDCFLGKAGHCGAQTTKSFPGQGRPRFRFYGNGVQPVRLKNCERLVGPGTKASVGRGFSKRHHWVTALQKLNP